ncbi:MAG: penicillin acylase family protein [Myxococcales bacterium]|nr:penicillin acylase family protein [Myxococcales bacterium]
MRFFTILTCVFALWLTQIFGCSESQQQEPDLEWPPDATAYFDQHGILNADCATDEDCAMVLGYYHSADRFVQMDFRRRFATGRLPEILDKGIARLAAVEPAIRFRALFSTREGVPVEQFALEQSSPKTVALLEAYSAGVNQWIEDVRNGENGAVFPREFEHPLFVYGPEDIPEWTPQDSLATVMALVEGLTNDYVVELAAGDARAQINDDDKFSDLWSRRPYYNSASLPPDWRPPSPESASLDESIASLEAKQCTGPEGLTTREALLNLSDILGDASPELHAIQGAGSPEGIGSNAWVISPALSTSGHPLVATDSHLPMTQPATYYLAHLDAKTHGNGENHVSGFTLAGLPWVLIGQTEGIAWGLTNTFYDLTDVYIEELVKDAEGNATGVMFQGEPVPFKRVPFTLRFSDGETEEVELLFVPHHGMVRAIDVDNDFAITQRWTANDLTTDADWPTEMNMAESLDGARQALENVTAVVQNVLIADTQGDIGWFAHGRVPKRTWATDLEGAAPPWLPLDGSCEAPESCYEWTDYFTSVELPQRVNPEEGFIASANNDMTGALSDGDPTTLPSGAFHPPFQVRVSPGYRRDRIMELIEEVGAEHTVDTTHSIQNDVYSPMGRDMVPGIVAIAEEELTELSSEAEKVVNALKGWNFECPTGLDGLYSDSPLTTDAAELLESSGCAAFHATLQELCERIHDNEHRNDSDFLIARAEGRNCPSFAAFYSIVDPSQLAAGDVYWDNPGTSETETKHEVMAEALDTVYDLFVNDKTLGTDETKWAWGRLHGLVLTSDIAQLGITQYNNPSSGPLFANPGGSQMVASAYAEDELVQEFGVQTRLVCELAPSGPTCTVQLPGGQSSHIDSPHYEDLLLNFLVNEPIELPFDIENAKANAVRTVTFR